ncbi:unnamed protein product [Chondrus crispus]|uniref:Uncharacterized protein n=1 Tax=Chondrus crispus TaxID=2769 RepID=R7QA46_CHOCR|nr:unnamed protein product [Chondrus crispus]CDF34286.1 unnamed protein product [Chondrus crispus]|eukprot:XP_005714105.1 unnamed protein product [Chondrus crispus]
MSIFTIPSKAGVDRTSQAGRILPGVPCFAFGLIPTKSNRLGRSSHAAVTRPSARRSAVSNSLSLPAWEREYEKDRGLVGTSYETATVEEVAPAGDGFLRITVDTAVTCTSQTYTSEGQFLFLKPWGDEDGSIEPCCFTDLPGEGTIMQFFVPEVSAVGEAALAGELLEVSEVMGKGFRPHIVSNKFKQVSAVLAVCIEQFCSPSLLALRYESRPSSIFLIAEKDGAFAKSLSSWMAGGSGNRAVYYFPDESSLIRAFEAQLEREASAAVLLSADRNLCHRAEEAVHRLGEGRNLYTFAP